MFDLLDVGIKFCMTCIFDSCLGSLLSSLKRKREAIDHYREAMRLSPLNYEANKGTISCTFKFQKLNFNIKVEKDVKLKTSSEHRQHVPFRNVTFRLVYQLLSLKMKA